MWVLRLVGPAAVGARRERERKKSAKTKNKHNDHDVGRNKCESASEVRWGKKEGPFILVTIPLSNVTRNINIFLFSYRSLMFEF